MRKIKKIWGGLGLLAAGLIGATCVCNPQIVNRQEVRTRPAITLDLAEGNKRTIYQSAENYLFDFFGGNKDRKGYIDFMAEHSGEIKKNIGEIGREQVIAGYAELHKKCLDIAVLRLHGEISERDIDELGDRMVAVQKRNSPGSEIDYEHPAVKEGYCAYGRTRAEFFKRVIEKNIHNPSLDFRELIKRAFTKEEFSKEIERQIQARKKLYEGFTKSFQNRGVFVKVFGPGVAEKTRQKSEEYNSREVEWIYGEK